MNRFPQQTEDTFANAPAKPDYAVELSRISISDDSMPHMLFAPLHYESGYSYPLIVWLHGAGDDEHQLKRVMPLVSMRNYVSIAPRGTLPICTKEDSEGFVWQQTAEEIAQAEQRVMAAIEIARDRYNVAENRIFIAGFQDGGTMAFRVALNHPHRFAGALSLGGGFPQGHQPLRRLNELRSLPLFLATGVEGSLYPQESLCQDLRLFHSAGLSVSVRQYPCADELTTVMLSDTNRWVMDHVCGNASVIC